MGEITALTWALEVGDPHCFASSYTPKNWSAEMPIAQPWRWRGCPETPNPQTKLSSRPERRDLLFNFRVKSLFMRRQEYGFYVYMMASRSHVLYCGITKNLLFRVEEHRQGAIEGFTATYNCKRLVWFERFHYVNNAIAGEKQIKRWRREKKIWLIEQANPHWLDLSEPWRVTTSNKPAFPPNQPTG